jgi:predicted ATPase with chaperone activity
MTDNQDWLPEDVRMSFEDFQRLNELKSEAYNQGVADATQAFQSEVKALKELQIENEALEKECERRRNRAKDAEFEVENLRNKVHDLEKLIKLLGSITK